MALITTKPKYMTLLAFLLTMAIGVMILCMFILKPTYVSMEIDYEYMHQTKVYSANETNHKIINQGNLHSHHVALSKKTVNVNKINNNINTLTSNNHDHLNQGHFCLNGTGIYSPLPYNYYHTFYNYSLLYNFQCPNNSSITSINNTISNMKFNPNGSYFTYIAIKIPFIAYDINNNAQQYGGDEFVVVAEGSDETGYQAFPVQDLFNGTYIIHILVSIPNDYTISIRHKFSCFDSMINEYTLLPMDLIYITTMKILKNNILFDIKDNKCRLSQNGIDMASSGMWRYSMINSWFPYCCHIIDIYNKHSLNSMEYIVGDSTLDGRTHEIGYPLHKKDRNPVVKTWHKLLVEMKENGLKMKHLGHDKKVILVNNINLHTIKPNVDLYKACKLSFEFICELIYYVSIYHKYNDLNIIIMGGVSIHQQLWPIKFDLITDFRVRWHDECIEQKIEMINNNISICHNKTIDDIVSNLEKNIWFININNMRIGRWDINRKHDKLHGTFRPVISLLLFAMQGRARTHDTH